MDAINQTKAAFAAFIFDKPGEAYAAAKQLADDPDDVATVAEMATTWPRDPFVKSEIARLKAEQQDEDSLPTKSDLARRVWEMTAASDATIDEKIKAAKLYAEIRNFIEKPVQGNGQVATIPSVMIVREHATDDDWEKAMAAQQDDLMKGKHVAKQAPK